MNDLVWDDILTQQLTKNECTAETQTDSIRDNPVLSAAAPAGS